jgi:hypothetical protein
MEMLAECKTDDGLRFLSGASVCPRGVLKRCGALHYEAFSYLIFV